MHWIYSTIENCSVFMYWIYYTIERGRRCRPVVRVLGLHVVPSGSSPVLTSGQDLFPVVTDSTLLWFVPYGSSGWGVGFACGCLGFKSCSDLWSGFVSSYHGFNSTTICNYISQLIASCELGFSVMFLLSLNYCFFQIIQSGVHLSQIKPYSFPLFFR